MRRRGPRPGLLGGNGAAAAALALLVLGCVFVALAGPRASLDIRTRALRSDIAAAPQVDKTVVVNGDWNSFSASLPTGAQAAPLSDVKAELGDDLGADSVPLSPRADEWTGLTTKLAPYPGAAASAQTAVAPVIEIIYRDVLGRYSRLIAGSYPGDRLSHGRIPIAVTEQTASRFSLALGSRLAITTPNSGALNLVVTGVISVRDPQATFWTADSLAAAPQLNPSLRPYWVGAVFAGPGSTEALQSTFGSTGMQVQWQFPLSLGQLTDAQAPAMADLLNRITVQAPALTGSLGPAALTLTVATSAQQELAAFLAAQGAVQTVLSLLFTGLAVIGAVVLLLAARMVTARRAVEYALLRARGASLRQLAALTLRDTAVAVVPAALLGGVGAVVLTPGGSPPLAGWLTGATVLIALAGPALIVVTQYRPLRPAVPAAERAGRSPLRRWVAEIAVVAAAIGGLIVLRAQGLPAAGGFNAYTSAAPVLVAIPAAICIMRLYPLALAGALRLSARRAGVTGFLAAARASRGAAALPLFALVLALSLAAFAGMVRDTVNRGEDAAAWRTTGADAVIQAGSARNPMTPAVIRALSGVPGVRHAVAVRVLASTTPGLQPVTVIAADPASYAALVASTPWPAFPAARLAERAGAASRGAPVLASPASAALLGLGGLSGTQLHTGQGSIRVRVAGLLSGTPALPAGGRFVVLPSWALPATVKAQQPPSQLLITGPRLDGKRLTALAGRLMPGAVTRLRSAELNELSGSPLPRAAYLSFGAGLAATAGFSVAILLLELALGAGERERTLARLATMGLGAGQARRLTMLETLPGVLAAAAAGMGCALALAPLTGPILNLTVFTGSGARVPVRPDFAALGLPVAGLILLAVGTLLIQIRMARRRGVTSALRLGH
ncbi:MAG TPA: FtsX-like permease family protein [Streptosporangiaceae bacterium]|jgi:putative ABC transport system permease protein